VCVCGVYSVRACVHGVRVCGVCMVYVCVWCVYCLCAYECAYGVSVFVWCVYGV